MKKRWIMITALVGIFLIGAVSVGPIMSNVETPKYELVTSERNIDVRRYDSMIIAEVEMNGPRADAIRNGFLVLAQYIFGNNLSKQGLEMTAPVQQQGCTKIPMTAPVQQQSTGNYWKISFIMPSEHTMETIPKPLNDLVTIKKIPSKTFAVIAFSGTNSDENIKDHENQLMKYVSANNLSLIDTPKYAFYNPPWTLPSMRRNEVMVEIQD